MKKEYWKNRLERESDIQDFILELMKEIDNYEKVWEEDLADYNKVFETLWDSPLKELLKENFPQKTKEEYYQEINEKINSRSDFIRLLVDNFNNTNAEDEIYVSAIEEYAVNNEKFWIENGLEERRNYDK